ncbi:hypothetical protein E2C01_044006 [Portunus trituberculatus]|uniref:Uncharacterized protein n=1 Tax=Portunus trituberculatus TaxID=210409 RepID=A0A5B7FYS6_PORTR|nr:hypothetical protein [Portunus trituberculatus]
MQTQTTTPTPLRHKRCETLRSRPSRGRLQQTEYYQEAPQDSTSVGRVCLGFHETRRDTGPISPTQEGGGWS